MITPSPNLQWKDFDYISGDIHKNKSIQMQRYYFLQELNRLSDDTLTLAFRDVETDQWTKWKPWYKTELPLLMLSYDIHRSLLQNEIMIESDYPNYEENYDAMQIIGSIIEDKGFTPMYYYSGGKSIHASIILDYKVLYTLPIILQEEIMSQYTKAMFIKKFMEFLRKKIVTCWGLKVRKFDEQVSTSRHLIRSEMSQNKHGYKTFLGYTRKVIPFVAPICNPDNGFYPEIGEIKLSRPNCIQELIEEFLGSKKAKATRKKTENKSRSLANWMNGTSGKDTQKQLRTCVRFILSQDFKEYPDGANRGAFILANELKRVYGYAEAQAMMFDWNKGLANPLADLDITYLANREQTYTLTCEYIHGFFHEIGFENFNEGCKS